MAYTKTNWQNLPSTQTPLNATNLNKIENQLETTDSKKVLFTSSLPEGNTSETITLNETIANFSEVEIDYSYGTNAYLTKKAYIKGTTVPITLDAVFCGNSNLQIMSAVISLNGTTLTRVRTGGKNIVISSNTITDFSNPTIAIHRIVGTR